MDGLWLDWLDKTGQVDVVNLQLLLTAEMISFDMAS